MKIITVNNYSGDKKRFVFDYSQKNLPSEKNALSDFILRNLLPQVQEAEKIIKSYRDIYPISSHDDETMKKVVSRSLKLIKNLEQDLAYGISCIDNSDLLRYIFVLNKRFENNFLELEISYKYQVQNEKLVNHFIQEIFPLLDKKFIEIYNLYGGYVQLHFSFLEDKDVA
jgi:hypothetical protein